MSYITYTEGGKSQYKNNYKILNRYTHKYQVREDDHPYLVLNKLVSRRYL